MRKPQKAALALVIALIAPLSACSSEADTTPEQSQTQGATEIPETPEDADGTANEEPEVDDSETSADDAESTDDAGADDTTDAKDETETAFAALKKIEDLRADVTDTRHDAAHLRGKIKGDTFEALGKTNGALGISTGAAKASQHNESHAPKKVDEALKKIERAQSQLQRAQQSLNDSSDSTANEIADQLLALIEGLDALRGDLSAL